MGARTFEGHSGIMLHECNVSGRRLDLAQAARGTDKSVKGIAEAGESGSSKVPSSTSIQKLSRAVSVAMFGRRLLCVSARLV